MNMSWFQKAALGTALFCPALEMAAATEQLQVERGRYLIRVAGCNDCHTPGYLQESGRTPEALWLTGSPFGWRGPWGTTYSSNLRLLMQTMTEDGWLQHARNLKARPPMPWFNLNSMNDEDLRSIFAFVHQLGPAGSPAPAYVPPDQEPVPPYAVFPSPPPPEK